MPAMPTGPQDDDEQDADALFQAAMRDVRPLRPAAQRRLPPPHTPPSGKRRRTPKARLNPASLPDSPDPVLDTGILAGDELRFARPGVAASTLRKLRRGQLHVLGALDLHGATAREARRILHEFLQRALERGAGCVRIVHGKGLRSGTAGPVLKQTVDAVLRAHPGVRAFTSASPADGGTGAAYVLLNAS